MRRSRRIDQAREVLPWVTAWARLIVDDATAEDVATRAVVRVASGRRSLTPATLRIRARDEAARLLARDHAADSHDPEPTPAQAPDPPEIDRRTPAEKLADGLIALRPIERLAAVRYFLDGETVESVAALLELDRAAAVTILEGATRHLAAQVGEYDLPDFSAAVTHVEVVSR